MLAMSMDPNFEYTDMELIMSKAITPSYYNSKNSSCKSYRHYREQSIIKCRLALRRLKEEGYEMLLPQQEMVFYIALQDGPAENGKFYDTKEEAEQVRQSWGDAAKGTYVASKIRDVKSITALRTL